MQKKSVLNTEHLTGLYKEKALFNIYLMRLNSGNRLLRGSGRRRQLL